MFYNKIRNASKGDAAKQQPTPNTEDDEQQLAVKNEQQQQQDDAAIIANRKKSKNSVDLTLAKIEELSGFKAKLIPNTAAHANGHLSKISKNGKSAEQTADEAVNACCADPVCQRDIWNHVKNRNNAKKPNKAKVAEDEEEGMMMMMNRGNNNNKKNSSNDEDRNSGRRRDREQPGVAEHDELVASWYVELNGLSSRNEQHRYLKVKFDQLAEYVIRDKKNNKNNQP
jgi:hypothetical protein